MQSYPLTILAGASAGYAADGDLFVFESGAVTGTSDQRIAVKPGMGSEILLRPGQRVRVRADQRHTMWYVRANDPVGVVVGSVIIGSGDFSDSNATVAAGSMTINNSTAQRVPVALDPALRVPVALDPVAAIQINNTTAQRVPVTLDPAQVLNTSGAVMAYQTSFNTTAEINAGLQIVSPAANVNGVIVNQWFIVGGPSGGPVAMLGKATAPTSYLDGDVLDMVESTNGARFKMTNQFKVPAGKGLYLYGIASSTSNKSVLYTVL